MPRAKHATSSHRLNLKLSITFLPYRLGAREEMKSKGFLDIEVWHWDGVPGPGKESLGVYRV